MEVKREISGADGEGHGCLEEVSVPVQRALEVGAREPYLVGVDGVGSRIVLGTVVTSSFVLAVCFFFAGISSTLVIPGIVGAILVDSRSKRTLLDKEIMLAGAMR